MEVSRAGLITTEKLSGEKLALPITFFSLNPSEQELYDSFRASHESLEKIINGMENNGLGTEQREKGEKEVEEMFLGLVSPYFEKQGLKPVGCFTTYGSGPRTTFLAMPNYSLPDKDGKKSSLIELDYQFFTKNENLFCESHLSYISGKDDRYEERVLCNLLEKIIRGKVQDGTNFPVVSFIGHLMHFAPTGFSVPLMHFIKDVSMKTDPKLMKGLKLLYMEYSNQKEEVIQKVLKAAYEKELQKAVQIHNFQQYLTRPVKASETIQ